MADSPFDKAQRAHEALQAQLDEGETGLDRMMFLMSMERGGLSATRGLQTVNGKQVSAWLLLPLVKHYPPGSKEQLEQEADWERRAIEMHKNQKTLLPADKPRDNSGLKAKRGAARELYRGN